MKILWVKPGKLLPLDTGGKLRTYNILRHLSVSHDVTYLSYYGGTRDQEYDQSVLQHLPGTVTVNTAVPDATGFERYLDYVRRLPGPAPYSVSRSRRLRCSKFSRIGLGAVVSMLQYVIFWPAH